MKEVLLTGATGFVGGAFLAHALGADARLVAIVRGTSEAHARDRLRRSVQRFASEAAATSLLARATVIVGDLADESTLADARLDGVTHVVHTAACTSFASTREAWRTNVVGTKLLLERLRRAPCLERFLHVSTAYACGDRPPRAVHEDDYPRPTHSYVNGYTKSKAEAERLVLAASARVPVLLARPSVIVGHTALGVRPSSSLFWYYRALAALGAGPFRPDARRDIVPVDYVAGALGELLHLPSPRFLAYHVSAGQRACVRLLDVLRALGMKAAWRSVGPDELGAMQGIALLARDPAQAARLSRGLRACAVFGALGVDYFDNERLLAEGVRSAPSFLDYLPRCLDTSAETTVYEQMIDDV